MIEGLPQLLPGWQARLQLRFDVSRGRTRLACCRHQGPLTVQRVFYPEAVAPAADSAVTPLADAAGGDSSTPLRHRGAEPCHVYVVHPPGGLVSGDELHLHVTVEPRAHALLTTPAATKFYRRRGTSIARAEQLLQVRSGMLEWLPQESIYYPETCATVRTRIHLANGARFIGWELACLGLPAIGAVLGGGSVQQLLELWVEGEPLLLEQLNVAGPAPAARWGLANHAAFGTWLAHPVRQADLETARSALSSLNCAEMLLACTIVDGVLCCRGLAQRADQLKQAFVILWQRLRLALLGRPPVAPRIWAT